MGSPRENSRVVSEPPTNERGFLRSCEFNQDRVYRTLHALERLSGVVSALTKRVESLEAAASMPDDVALRLSLANLEFPARTTEAGNMEADIVKQVTNNLAQDLTFQETLLDKLEVSRPHREVVFTEETIADVATTVGPDRSEGLQSPERRYSEKSSRHSQSTYGSQASNARSALQHARGQACGHEDQTSFKYTRSDFLQARKTWMSQAQMYKFGESAWDAAMFAFNDMISAGDSVFLLIMFVTNAFLQFGLVTLVWTPFTQPTLDSDSIHDAASWRTSIAHDARWMDSVTSQSLARLVCSSDSPYMSVSQRLSLAQILHYAPNKDWGSLTFGEISLTGELVCSLCLILWWSTLYVELRDVLECLKGLYFMPMKDRTIVMLLKPGDIDDVALRSMTLLRKSWCLTVLLFRFLVSAMLLFIGSTFLVYTLAVRDLLLNALALEFLLQLDELTFIAMAPLTVRHFINCLCPIPKEAGHFYRTFGFDVNIAMYFVFIPICLLFTVPLLLDQNTLIEKTRETMCGGNLDFVFTKDPGGAIVAHPSYVSPGALPEPKGPKADAELFGVTQYQTRAVQQLVDDVNAVSMSPWDSLSDTAPALFGSALGLLERPSILLGERMSQLNPFCDDISERAMVWPNSFVGAVVGDHPALSSALVAGSSCSVGAKLCNYDNEVGSIMRRWCSRTCGCHQANSSLILSKDYSGCPMICTSQQPYVASREEAKCEDKDASSQAFQDYIFGLSSVRDSYLDIDAWATMFAGWIDNLSKNGCSGHVLYDGGGNVFGDLCGETAFGLKPLQWLCPVTCKCGSATTIPGSAQAPLCPTSCSSSTMP